MIIWKKPFTFVALAVVVATVAFFVFHHSPEPPQRLLVAAPDAAILAPDDEVHAKYAGSESCKKCHSAEFEKLHPSNHGQAKRMITKADHKAFEPKQSLTHGEDSTEAFAAWALCASLDLNTDLPEIARLAGEGATEVHGLPAKDYWDARARGLGGSETDPYCSVGEENVLGYPGDPYEKESILIHEFAHKIHLRGMINVDPSFDQRLKDTYAAAMKAGLWKGKYAATNHLEYNVEIYMQVEPHACD